MVSKPPGRAARRRHDIDVHVTVVFTGESDESAIGGENGIGLRAGAGSQACGVASVSRNTPEVARKREDDMSFVDGRFLGKQRVRGIGRNGGAKKQGQRGKLVRLGLVHIRLYLIEADAAARCWSIIEFESESSAEALGFVRVERPVVG